MKHKKMHVTELYASLLKLHGLQGWWPLLCLHDSGGCNPTKSGSIKGYHPGDYSYPKNDMQRFEICLGAILTQNTAWPNVEKALLNLSKIHAIDPEKIISIDENILKEAIKPAGYFNQKARKLREFAKFFIDLKGRTPSRDELLSVWGVGPETADSILLYAYKVPVFVVDAYAKRIFVEKGIISMSAKYDDVKNLVEISFGNENYMIFQEFHALLVNEGKQH